jgi:hypothetical protein
MITHRAIALSHPTTIALPQPKHLKKRSLSTIPDKQKAIAPHQNTSKSDRSFPSKARSLFRYFFYPQVKA